MSRESRFAPEEATRLAYVERSESSLPQQAHRPTASTFLIFVNILQEKVHQRLEKMRAVQEGLSEDDLLRRDRELSAQVAQLESKRDLSQIWLHVSSSALPEISSTDPSCPHVQQSLHTVQVDMDAFFAACEERDNPELAKIPIAST
jgi:hypothetical protein